MCIASSGRGLFIRVPIVQQSPRATALAVVRERCPVPALRQAQTESGGENMADLAAFESFAALSGRRRNELRTDRSTRVTEASPRFARDQGVEEVRTRVSGCVPVCNFVVDQRLRALV
jgi:hypothetical protein